MGVFPATLCPFHEDETIDEAGLRAYIAKLCQVPGVKGLVPNGHTGEIMSLRENERARVTRIVAEEVKRSGKALKVISGVCGEGSLPRILNHDNHGECGPFSRMSLNWKNPRLA